ncbi:MAG: helix-turn-helix domain-containing protein [Actinomycetota bacterium]|nr:helix-turn-helix domain-containing protein [Actinomycetota bacterium]
MEKLMSVKELAKYLGVTERTIYNMIERGEIPSLKVGGQYRFREDDVALWLDKASAKKGGQGLERVKWEKDPLTKRLFFMALLTKALEPSGIKPIIIGGNAVEFYTAGGYATADIDIIAPTEPIDIILKDWGFSKEGRHWISEEFDIVIEAPASYLEPEQLKRIYEVEIEDLRVYILGVEDLIIDRLNACVHWKSKGDGEWAKELMMLHLSEIDWDYIEERAETEKVKGALAELRGELKVDEDC